MREDLTTITINEEGIRNIIRGYYADRGHAVTDFQIYEDRGNVYTDIRIKGNVLNEQKGR